MIQPGLERISRLVPRLSMPWRAVHVAGTNGKGSVCSYVSAMLTAGQVRCGRFTSPHLIDRWDCISINDKSISRELFEHAENEIRSRDSREDIKASEFEMLTATAFEIFTAEKVQVAIVEAGMGGRYDATNILHKPLSTVITKIAMDHESYLGSSLEAIAHHKAGIIKAGVPCVIDGTNKATVVDVLKQEARAVDASKVIIIPQEDSSAKEEPLQDLFRDLHLESHQQMNLSLAYEATKCAMEGIGRSMESQMLSAIPTVSWPGRLQLLDLSSLIGQKGSVVLDGAHNASSIEILASYVDRKIRPHERPVTWVTAFSQGKDIQGLLSRLVKPNDNLIATTFGPVDGMPWVQATPTRHILESLNASIQLSQPTAHEGPIEDVLKTAAKVAQGKPIVVAGSLYLVSDVLRLLRLRQGNHK